MKYFRPYLNLSRTVYILFFARIINSIGSFVYPLLAILLTLKLGFPEDVAGRITTIAIASGGIGLLVGGKLSDRFGRKKNSCHWKFLWSHQLSDMCIPGNFTDNTFLPDSWEFFQPYAVSSGKRHAYRCDRQEDKAKCLFTSLPRD